ncbi:MAG TPA: winged helix-turn-helix domain-containing protein [Solirubrobacterales bacterium]|nr:winged helix-turn-helix domain-containing protein [Solirubrobacterales bacterium]
MTPKSRPREDAAQTLIKVAAHPIRVGALAILTERSASPKQIADELDEPVGNVSYHVRELEQMGLVELVDERRRRGAVEHFYEAVPKPPLSGADWEKLSPAERGAHSAWTLQLLLADATRSLSAGTFDARPDRQLSRTRLEVDEQGWRELVAIQAEALRATREVADASAARLREADGEGGFPVLTSMLCFEAPSSGRRST